MVVWLKGRCCRIKHACPMNDEIQMKTQKGGDLLRETEETRQKGKKKKRITENKRLHPNPAEFDTSGVHAFI